MKKHLLIAFLISISLVSKAQDIHFSQYFLTPLGVSPSNTGNYDGDWRIMGNYRSQWSEIKPYVTAAIGGDMNFNIGPEKISAGVFYVNDKSGGNLQVNKIMLSGAYHKTINKNNLHVGLQPVYVMKSIDKDSETYPNQLNWNTGSFDKGLPSNEAGLTNKLSYLDLNLGVGWSKKMGKLEPYASYAVYHINAPKESFFGATNKLKPRSVLNIGANYKLNNTIVLQPSIQLMGQSKASELLGGANLVYAFKSSGLKSVFIGEYVRYGIGNLTDAAFTTVGANFKNYTVGVSYDVNISQLKTATNSRGAFEVAFIYTGLTPQLPKKEIPCDRY